MIAGPSGIREAPARVKRGRIRMSTVEMKNGCYGTALTDTTSCDNGHIQYPSP